ncbi:MAG: hypothetical protein MUP76_04640 [Acidimicrobiia bacterium]|nr:hypothetical protein [Acidimicrobiia bacterium]
MREFSLFVPGELWTINRERNLHHHARAKLVEPMREAAKLLCQNKMRANKVAPFTTLVEVTFRPVQKPGVLADTANHLPPCKAVLDGLVDAKLIEDDTPRYVGAQVFVPPTKSKNTGIWVYVTEVEP